MVWILFQVLKVLFLGHKIGFVRIQGVLVDENLSFKNNINHLRFKVSRNLGIIREVKVYFSWMYFKAPL